MYTVEYKDKRTTFVGHYGEFYASLFRNNQFYEMDFLQHIENLAISGEYLDIGGNIGNHAMFFAMHCQAEKVYTFEPLNRYQKYIENNINANNLGSKIELCKCGLSDSEENVQFKWDDAKSETIINPKTLDSFAEIFKNVSLIKIDVEGLECNVIRGGEKVIMQHKPIIFCEILSQNNLTEIDNLLGTKGYVRSDKVFNSSLTYEYICK